MPREGTVDTTDAKILLELDRNPDATILALSRSLGIARNTVHARIRRLTDNGVIGDFSRRVDPAAIGYGLVAFVQISLAQNSGEEAIAGLGGIPEVIEMHSITGDADLLAKVVARNTLDLHRLTGDILGIDGVTRTSTAISLTEVLPMRLDALLGVLVGSSAGSPVTD
ncbi:Lrp/AsnC family transcriptional regulator [Plantibacter sp. YIM 135249]|uniref:Lrp/AsnC family transcriptional regulator n=1 Tax=Plantibacter sp. YIM 135249 TaxID=3423918 RepID=UPI003D34D2BC